MVGSYGLFSFSVHLRSPPTLVFTWQPEASVLDEGPSSDGSEISGDVGGPGSCVHILPFKESGSKIPMQVCFLGLDSLSEEYGPFQQVLVR